jgi:lathosterol oxidase
MQDSILAALDYLSALHPVTLFLLFLAENILIAAISILLGFMLDGLLTTFKDEITLKEIGWTCSTIFFNTLVTLAGYKLFQHGVIIFHLNFSGTELLADFLLLIVAMDFMMYVFHWAIHKLHALYRYHDLHHQYNNPTAVSLFVLHPVEVLGFGGLWLCLLTAIDFSIYAITLYLMFNVAMGIIGHLRKEFIPASLKNHTFFQWLANTGFHVDHHQYQQYNFGFYTKVWDHIFGTLK